jgi:hypothetical protein
LIALLALPRVGTAGLVDVILEMSGPRMIGIAGDIRILPNGCVDSVGVGGFTPPPGAAAAPAAAAGADNRTKKCKEGDGKPRNRFVAALGTFGVKEREMGQDESGKEYNYWYSLSAGYYFSIPKTIDGHPYKYFDVQMITFEPMVEFQSRSSNVSYSEMKLQVYHGIGGGMDVLFVEGTPPTTVRGVIKFRPAGVVVPFGKRWGFDIAYDLRLYPKGFIASDFHEVASPITESNNWEFVHAFAGSVRWKF